MADTSASSAGGGGGPKPLPPPRPSITVPSRSSTESALFRGGGASEASPGPLTLVSSFFDADPETECRPFTQLLVDAMNFPARAKAEQEDVAVAGSAAGRVVWSGQDLLPSLQTTSSQQLFTVPPGLSPASLLESPATLFPSGYNMGNFGLAHQSALPQVKAQTEMKIPSQQENLSSFLLAATTSLAQQPVPEIPLTRSSSITFESSEEWSQPVANCIDKPADDGYNWRKYGQKMVRGSQYPRGYYKCTHPTCPVSKKVERSVEGQVTEIIYKGQHNHQCPRPNKQSKEGHNFPTSGLSETSSYGAHGNSVPSISSRDHQHSLSEPSDKVVATTRTAEEEDVSGPDPKIRCTSVSSQKTLAEPRIVVQTTSEVDLLDDGYRWRKYGQKVVKGSTHPRSYYKCTYMGCNVRKHIERASSDPRAVITTYEGKHNHELPAARNSSHHTANAVAVAQQMQLDHDSLISTNFRRNHQAPVAALQLKEEDK